MAQGRHWASVRGVQGRRAEGRSLHAEPHGTEGREARVHALLLHERGAGVQSRVGRQVPFAAEVRQLLVRDWDARNLGKWIVG